MIFGLKQTLRMVAESMITVDVHMSMVLKMSFSLDHPRAESVLL